MKKFIMMAIITVVSALVMWGIINVASNVDVPFWMALIMSAVVMAARLIVIEVLEERSETV